MAGKVLGIGIDIIRTSRFERLLEKKKDAFIQKLGSRVLHAQRELPKFNQFWKEKKMAQCVSYLSGSWASKEALYKTLSKEDQAKFEFKTWYRYHDEDGKPYIWNNEYLKNEEFLLSISHDGDILIANVLRQEK